MIHLKLNGSLGLSKSGGGPYTVTTHDTYPIYQVQGYRLLKNVKFSDLRLRSRTAWNKK